MSCTTVLASNSSTSPISGLNCASILRWWPNFFFAADTMAFSRALTRIDLSMPFSLLTCSMTLFRSCCIFGTPIVLVIRLFNRRERYLAARAVLTQRNPIAADFQVRPEKRSPPLDRLAGAHADFLADELREMRRPLERPVDARRRNLQRVSALDQVLLIEKRAQFAAHPAEIVHVGTARFIEIQAQHTPGPRAFAPELDVKDFHALGLGQRRRDLPNARDGRIHADSPRNKKSGQCPLRVLTPKV